MFDFLTASQNTPFTVALAVMFGIAILEGVTALFGMALSGMLDALLPDLDIDLDAELSGPEYQSPNALSRLLGWLRVGQVPVLMLLVILLTGFGLIGLGIQSALQHSIGVLLPGIVASVPAAVLALPVVRVFGGLLEKVMPKDETDAVSEESLVGLIATVTLGRASAGQPAEAKVRDPRGTTHYVMVEPDDASVQFEAGSQVLLVSRSGATYAAIVNPNPVLVDE